MAVYTVTEFTTYLKEFIDHQPFMSDLWIYGEVSNLSRPSSGNIYFTIKDGQSQLRCVMFRPGSRADLVSNGGAVILHGRIALYAARGDIQLYVDIVQPEGTGILQLELEQLKAKLDAAGFFDITRKRPLPQFPQTIGVVTSPTGAVFQDICTVIRRRYPLVHIILSPTMVQGDQAALGIVEALHALNSIGSVDVIIVARGGGSIEELLPFNKEEVAHAIYGSHVPVISGVGHETDTTIADLVADHRAPTPSAAAEIAVPDATRLQRHVLTLQRATITATDSLILQKRHELDLTTQRIKNMKPQINTLQQSIDELIQGLTKQMIAYHTLISQRFFGIEKRLSTLDPVAVLNRGYAIIEHSNDSTLISKVTHVQSGDAAKVIVSDGSFDVQVV